MYHLHTLGLLDLRAEDGERLDAVLAQPRRAALLAYLALARPRGPVRRDTLLALFWPEAPAPRARAALRNALSFIRRALPGVLESRLDDAVGLDPATLGCDAWTLEDAFLRGEMASAAALYRGELLAGFHADGAPAWEDWLGLERRRFARMAAAAAAALAERAEVAGDAVEELRWRRMAADMDPFDEVALRGLLLALDAAGDRAGALEAYEAFARRVRTAHDAEPASETVTLVRAIRARRPADRSPVDPDPVPAPTASAVVDAPADPTPGPGRAPAAWRRWAVAAGSLAACTLVLLATQRARPGSTTPGVVQTRVAVLPFTVRTAPSHRYLGEGMTDLISARLDGTGALTTVDPYAMLAYLRSTGSPAATPEVGRAASARFAAGRFVLGSVLQAGERLHLQATLYDQTGRPRARAEVALVREDSLFAGVDALVRELVADQLDGPAQALGRTAALSTASLPALKAYLAGERDFRRGAFGDATASFARAAELDSTFALAFYRLSVAQDWAATDGSAAAARALRLSAHLSPTDRALLEARVAFRTGSGERAEAILRSLLAARPDHVEAWNELGEVVNHRAMWTGRPVTQAMSAWERVLALDPGNVNARLHLAHLLALEGRRAEMARMVEEVTRLSPGHEAQVRLNLLRAFGAGRPADRLAWMDSLRRRAAAPRDAGDDPPWGAAWRAADFLRDPEVGLAISAIMTLPSRSPRGRLVGHATRAHFWMARGQWRAARGEIEAARRLDPGYAARVWAFLVGLSPVPVPAEEIRAARAALARTRPPRGDGVGDIVDHERSAFPRARHVYLLGTLAVRLGDTAAVRGAIAALGVPGDEGAGAVVFTRHLRAQLEARMLRAGGHPAAALAATEAGWPEPRPEHFIKEDSYSTVAERFFRAELLADLGRRDEALSWYASTTEDISRGLVFSTAAALGRARILERLGRKEEAAAEYGHYATTWRDADPEVQPAVARARSRASAP